MGAEGTATNDQVTLDDGGDEADQVLMLRQFSASRPAKDTLKEEAK
jgi:hypothetical protein